jgi:hypothetical protein
MKEKTIKQHAKFTKKEIDFINEIAISAFSGEHRSLVLIGICESIIENIVFQSNGVFNKKQLLDLMGLSDDNLDIK